MTVNTAAGGLFAVQYGAITPFIGFVLGTFWSMLDDPKRAPALTAGAIVIARALGG